MTALDTRPEVAVFECGLYNDMDEDTYFGDPVPGGSLSVSGAKLLLPPSCPAKFRQERLNPSPPSKAMNIGSAAHKLVLGSGPEIVVIDKPNYQTKLAQETRDNALAVGKIPVLVSEYAEVSAMADAIRDHAIAGALFDPERGGSPEVSLFWEDNEGAPIIRRCRIDWLPDTSTGDIIIGDYKTTVSGEPEDVPRHCARFHYHQQHAWYVDGVKAMFPGARVRFIFIFQEKTPPYLITPVELDYNAVELGRDLNRAAIAKYVQCTENDDWPGYLADTKILKVSLPSWAFPRG